MKLKDIVVHVDHAEACRSRVALAVELARRHDAHLACVNVDTGLQMPVLVDAPVMPALMEQLEADHDKRQASARALFESVTAASGVNVEWRVLAGEMAAALTREARRSDLLIVGQESNDPQQTVVPGGLPDTLALACGRPVLVVPYIGATAPPGQRVLLAWNGSRESTRAANDALPLLYDAEMVQVVSVNPRKDSDADLPGSEMALHLARHGVRAEAHRLVASEIDVSDALLSHAADMGADLIVTGAYGHSRFRELVLGGVTRGLLQHMTVPVLMSH